MPWHVERNGGDCPTDRPYAVVSDPDGSVESCHPTESDANDHVTELRAGEDATGAVTTLAATTSPDLASDVDVEAPQLTAWEGVLVVEDVSTGDGRKFAAGSITWAEPPLTLRWKKEDAHGGQNDVTVAIGSIAEVWRDGALVRGRGTIDLVNQDGAEAARRIAAGYLGGISIDADDITDADIEYIWPEVDAVEGSEDEADVLMMLFAPPEQMIFHAGRIRAATLCDIPAFVEAYVTLVDVDEDTLVASSAAASVTVVPSHTTATSDDAWDSGRYERRLPTSLSVGTARAAYAWIDDGAVADGAVARTDCRFMHHEVGVAGDVGPANLTACSSGIGVLHGGRGGTSVPESRRRGIYEHLARHLRDAGREPEPFVGDALVAHAVLGDDWRPPAEWFDDPRLNQAIPIIVTDEGRVYGHAAQWGQCHVGYVGECIMPPPEDDRPYFHTGEVVCADGRRVAVGQITAGIGHAPLHMRANPAAEHYDNTDAVVADVVVGNDRHGIWVAGAVRPWVDVRRVHELRASGQVSPDWRRVGGDLRMIGLLTVNESGYQVPHVRTRVASGEVQALIACGLITTARRGPTPEELNRRALRLLRDRLVNRVHPEGTKISV